MSDTQFAFVISAILLWILVAAYWVVSARRISGNSKSNAFIAFLKMVGSASIIFLPSLLNGIMTTRLYTPNTTTSLVGILLCLAGIYIMIWARVHLGKNWSEEVVIQKEHTLTKTGPYKFVRHPIYSGGLLFMLGSATIVGYAFSFIWALFCFIGLSIKSKKEEALLSKQFPNEYPKYIQHTKMLLPLIW